MRAALLVLVVALLAAGGVWAAASSEERGRPAAPVASATPSATPTPTPAPAERPARRRARRERLPSARCPDGLTRCRSVRGRVVYVERVDPDGDGDLHVVLAAGNVTAPGLTSVDVAPALRPRRDPRVGDRVSAAGQVQRGSFGQSQIHASEFHARRG